MYHRWLEDWGDYLRLDHDKVESNGVPEVPVIFDLEVLHDGVNPTKLWIYHLNQELERINNPSGYQTVYTTNKGLFVPRDTKTWSYGYDCSTGRLEEICRYKGDFTDPYFDWGRDRGKEYKGREIQPVISEKILKIATGLKQEIFSRRSQAKMTKEIELYHSFLRAFDHI